MIAAFACELALKAISLTGTDEASETPDLLKLFDELPHGKPGTASQQISQRSGTCWSRTGRYLGGGATLNPLSNMKHPGG